MPSAIPRVDAATLRRWQKLTYPDLVVEILALFVPETEISPPELSELVHDALRSFGCSSVVRVNPLANLEEPVNVLELFHGPTLAFKDLGMSVLVEMLQLLLRQRNQRLTLLVGTSGDTGASALEACRRAVNIDCVVLYPKGRVSAVQEGQMQEAGATMHNGHVISVEGTSDDLDVPCEAIHRDTAFKAAHSVGTVNSVNIVRMLVQVCHYFYAYFRVTADDDFWRTPEGEGAGLSVEDVPHKPKPVEHSTYQQLFTTTPAAPASGLPPGWVQHYTPAQVPYYTNTATGLSQWAAPSAQQATAARAARSNLDTIPNAPKINFSVPSGAGGHLMAGCMARAMGLPTGNLIVATNDNDTLDTMISQGVLARSAEVKQTNSNAMDIQVPYNYERLLFLCTQGDARLTKQLINMAQGRDTTVPLPNSVLRRFSDLRLVSTSVGQGTNEHEVLHTIERVFKASDYVVDPHTAVGVAAALKLASAQQIPSVRAAAPAPAARDADATPEPLPPKAHPVCTVCMGCAHPAKFPETVADALGMPPQVVVERLRKINGEGVVSEPARPAGNPHVETALDIFTASTRGAGTGGLGGGLGFLGDGLGALNFNVKVPQVKMPWEADGDSSSLEAQEAMGMGYIPDEMVGTVVDPDTKDGVCTHFAATDQEVWEVELRDVISKITQLRHLQLESVRKMK